jgi:hypothetical protein
MHYYDEGDADKDSEEEYSARNDDESDDNGGEDSEAGEGKCCSTYPFVYSFLSRISYSILKCTVHAVSFVILIF